MKIYTRTGDKGITGLFGGTRISKSSVRLHAYGTLDELNASLGVVLATTTLPDTVREELVDIQSFLFTIGADLATPLESKANILRTDPHYAEKLERWIDEMDMALEPMTKFILPGGCPAAALLHEARTICRRAERWIVELKNTEKISDGVIIVVNRLSDYLFTAARYANKITEAEENEVSIPRK